MRVTYYYNWGFPHPVRYGADTVAANHLEYFKARGWAVHVVTPRVPGKDEAAFRAAVPWLDGLTVLDLPPAPATFREQLDLYVAAARDPRVIAAVGRPADVLFTNYVYTAPLARLRPPGCRAVVETHDVMAEQSRIQAIVARPPGAAAPPLLDRGRDFLRRVEHDLYRLFDAAVMISRDELAEVVRLGAANTHYVPQFAAKAAACGTDPDAPFDLLFVGSDVAPNVAGLRWFYRHVYVPHLWHRGVTLAVGGAAGLATGFRDHGVTTLGRVDGPLANVYRRGRIVIAPVFHGTGLSIKVIEALAHGKAVVAAPAAARGLDGSAGAFVLADMHADPAETARTLLELLADAPRRRELEVAAAAYAEREFGRAAFVDGMDRVMRAAGVIRG